MLKLLYEGILIRENGIIKKASSSSTLIITNNHNIIVDTSTRDMKDMIIKGLSELNLTLDDIDVVINTHLHYDHIENNSLFKNATFYASPKEFGFDDNFEDFRKLKDKEIEIIETPGHTYGSISVIYKDYVVVGDASPLRNNILKMIPPKLHVDEKLALESLKKIRELKKNVITGHEGIVYKEELL
jgi:glyoxylase-like metal-dependent hydrolase (beta-lactamase superfamily II)